MRRSPATLARACPRWLSIASAALVASAGFGLYHLTYAPPWNTPEMALKLSGIWLEVAAVYLLTGSLWAAAAVNTVMALIGFVLNGVMVLDEEPLWLGLGLDGISVVAIIVATRSLQRRLWAHPTS